MLGRDFLPEEDRPGASPVCIIGYSIWERRYGSRADILGKSIRINEVPTTIVGVMPKGMKFPVNADIWIPLVPQGRLGEARFPRNGRLRAAEARRHAAAGARRDGRHRAAARDASTRSRTKTSARP